MLKRRNPANPEKELELLEHLGEFRTRFIRVVAYIVIGTALTWSFYHPLYELVMAPALGVIQRMGGEFLMTTFISGFTLRLQVSLIGGLVLSAPFWTVEFWMFIAPGLTKDERKALYFIAPFSIFLFALGVSICYLGLPRALEWFAGMVPPGAELKPDVQRTLVFVVQMYLAFGIVFEMPIVLMFLAKIGLVNSRMMVHFWKEAVVGMAAMSALITPSGDAFTLMLMATPMCFLYFGSIGLVRWIEKKESAPPSTPAT